MKKVLLSVTLVLVTFVSANAQFYLGGTVGFENNSELSPKSSFWVAPEAGFYINKKFDVGLELGFAKSDISIQFNEKNCIIHSIELPVS